jgi:ribonuclease P protein component
MLSRKQLIPLRKEFGRIKQDAKQYDSPSFGLLVSYGADDPQCAFIVSKKIDRRSVVRHAVKRKLAEAIRPFLPHLAKNLELVFLAKQKAIESTQEQLAQEIENVLRRAQLLV